MLPRHIEKKIHISTGVHKPPYTAHVLLISNTCSFVKPEKESVLCLFSGLFWTEAADGQNEAGTATIPWRGEVNEAHQPGPSLSADTLPCSRQRERYNHRLGIKCMDLFDVLLLKSWQETMPMSPFACRQHAHAYTMCIILTKKRGGNKSWMNGPCMQCL